MASLKSIAFVVNADKAGANRLAAELTDIARGAGAETKRTHRRVLPQGYLRGCDACCVIGGDGTLLGVAQEAARADVPIIGINLGGLGFLTTFSAEDAQTRFAALLGGAFRVDRRSMLDCAIGGAAHVLALNDVLIKTALPSGLVRLEVYADDELVSDYLCDGLIFSTPTGSTAYNLSAGGPIVHPAARVVSMTPICPHTLSNRTVILRENVHLRVQNRTTGARLLVAVDGQRHLAARPDLPVRISIARQRLSLAHMVDYSHFAVVRAKLRWSGGFAEKK